MQFTKTAIVRVLIVLYLSVDAWSHYIPENRDSVVETSKKSETSSHKDRIQICGNALTTMIIEACDGIVSSLDQAMPSRESLQTKITEDCCDRECPLDYLQNYCGQTPLFTTKKTVRGRLLSKLSPRNRISKSENLLGPGSGRSEDMKKTALHQTERQNKISRTWPSIQIGTVSPEIDKFGGQPVVVVKKNGGNSNSGKSMSKH